MKKNLTELVFILDRSGSMSGLESDTIGGFNAMIAKQKREEGEALVSTVLFDNDSAVIHDRVPIREVQPMTEREYFTRGCTALLDAVGGAIHHIGNVHKYAREEDCPDKTLFVITTDGYENASRRYDYERVRKMIERQKEKYGWEFLFLGANIDAAELMNVGSNYLREHIPPGCMLHYAVLNTGGFSPNVVQAEAESTYLIRGAKVEDAAAVKARVDKIAQGAALMTETEVEIIFQKACSHYMPNSVLGKLLTECLDTVGTPAYDEADFAFANAIRATTPTKAESSGLLKKMFLPLLPAEQKAAAEQMLSAEFNTICLPAVTMRQTAPGSTDVGDVSLNCPVSWFQYVTCAQGTPAHSWQMVAQGKSAAAHKGTVQAGKVIALAAVRLLEDETILPRAWEEFRSSMGGKRYVCPIPDEYNKL